MSSVIKYIVIVVGICLMTCSEAPEKVIFGGPDFVFIDSEAQVSLYENQKTPLILSIKVSVAQANTTKIGFVVIGDNVLAGSDYKVQTNSPVEILRGKYAATVSIIPVDNTVIQPEVRTITVRITSVDNPNLTPQVVKEVQVNLLDDDCSPNVPKVVLWKGNVGVSGDLGGTGTADAGAGGICGGTLVVTGKFAGERNPSSNLTIIMTQSSTDPTKGFASVARVPLFSGQTTYDYEASGSYDEVTKTISLNFTIYNNSDHTQDFSGTQTITPI